VTSRITGIVVVGAIVAALIALVAPHSDAVPLVLLAAGIVVGELLEIQSTGGPPLPLSHAVVLVVVALASAPAFAVTIVAAEVVAGVLRSAPSLRSRVVITVQRCLGAAVAYAVFRVGVDVVGNGRTKWAVLASLAAAGAAQIGLDELVAAVARRGVEGAFRAWRAELALVTSGVLMAVGQAGAGGRGMGLWGPLIFSVPLLATWYSFNRLSSIRRTYDQTIRALSVAPELGGLVRTGHAQRVATLSVAVGRELGLDHNELEQLEIAALLHHIGHLCLDDAEVLGRPADPWEVAEAGAAILRATDYLAPAGDLLAVEPLRHRRPPDPGERRRALGGQVLKVASAFDELTGGDQAHAPAAIEALYSGPGYLYDTEVLAALERVLVRSQVQPV